MGVTTLKGSVLKNKIKLKLFNKLNECQKFCVIIKQSEVNENVFSEKKNKQRFLDYAYKRAIKNILFDLIKCGKIIEEEIENIHFSIDEHSTATNGKYELSEGIKQELLYGTFNNNWCVYHPPLFEKNKKINIHDAQLCESKHEKNRMIRASDIIANRVFYLYSHRKIEQLNNIPNLHILYLP